MIQKLRRKFVAVVMGATALILLVVFVVLIISTKTGMARQSRQLLEMALGEEPRREAQGFPGEKNAPPEKRPLEGGLQERSPCFTVWVDGEGAVTLEDRAALLFSGLDPQEIQELAQTAAKLPESSGVLSAYRLRYARRERPGGVQIAFADTSMERSAMEQLIKSSLLIGGLTLLAFFGAGLLLARWAVRPVEQAWEQQKQFVGNASHELKTPLTVILSNADMILAHPGESELRWAENIKAEALRMKALTGDLLSLARSEDPAGSVPAEPVDLSCLVTDCVLSFEPAAFENGRSLTYQTAPGLTLSGDPAGLSRLCGILLDNALKYSRPGGKICVELEPAGRSARLSVSNEGEPIPPEELSRIFERFYRADASRHSEGYGLGLAIARQIAERHKGKIWAESCEGTNTFRVLLPCTKRPEKP